jgi:hypothetical protein
MGNGPKDIERGCGCGAWNGVVLVCYTPKVQAGCDLGAGRYGTMCISRDGSVWYVDRTCRNSVQISIFTALRADLPCRMIDDCACGIYKDF